MNYKIIILLCLATSLTSCIGTKRLTYLQESKSEIDSVMTVHQVEKPYRVQVNDLLDINVKAADAELERMFQPTSQGTSSKSSNEQKLYFDGFMVDSHGDIRLPTLGKINVLGYTVEEIREKIESKLLNTYFKHKTDLFVRVKLAGVRYTTIGEIGSGSQVIYKNQVTIMEAVANAGGIEITGDRTNVVILRKYPGGDGIHHIDLTNIDATHSPFYYIKPNDLIIVNPLPQKSYGFGTNGLQTFSAISSAIALFTSLIILATRF